MRIPPVHGYKRGMANDEFDRAASGAPSGGTIPSLTLNDGNAIPQLGLGTWRMDDDVARRCVRHAIGIGYRHIDTASLYRNEVGVGQGIADAIAAGDVAREDLFVTTKIWNDDQRGWRGVDDDASYCPELRTGSDGRSALPCDDWYDAEVRGLAPKSLPNDIWLERIDSLCAPRELSRMRTGSSVPSVSSRPPLAFCDLSASCTLAQNDCASS